MLLTRSSFWQRDSPDTLTPNGEYGTAERAQSRSKRVPRGCQAWEYLGFCLTRSLFAPCTGLVSVQSVHLRLFFIFQRPVWSVGSSSASSSPPARCASDTDTWVDVLRLIKSRANPRSQELFALCECVCVSVSLTLCLSVSHSEVLSPPIFLLMVWQILNK